MVYFWSWLTSEIFIFLLKRSFNGINRGNYFNSPIVLSSNENIFADCTFQSGSANYYFVYVNNPNAMSAFFSCLFFEISIPVGYYLLCVQSAANAIINRCCFLRDNSGSPYTSGVPTCHCIPLTSVNATLCMNCKSRATPFWGGTKDFAYFHNNNTHLIATEKIKVLLLPYDNSSE